jgi:hypothetical protein
VEPVLNWTIEVTHYRIKQTTARLGSSPAGSLFFLAILPTSGIRVAQRNKYTTIDVGEHQCRNSADSLG